MAKQAGKGVEEFRPYVTKVIPVGANIVCADNSGAKILEVINVPRHKTRSSRLASASDGEFSLITVLALDLIGIISQAENPIKINMTQSVRTFVLTQFFFLV